MGNFYIKKEEIMSSKCVYLLYMFGLFFLFNSCDSFDTVCTLEFRSITIKVVAANNDPVILDKLTVTNLETDRVVEICNDDWLDCENGVPAAYRKEGIYIIFHDGLRDEISGEKSAILVEGNNEEVNFQEEFVIGDDGCHVFKAAGPDTVFVELE